MADLIIDRSRLVVFMRVAGFLDADAIDAIADQMRTAARTLGDSMGQHDFLYDLTETKVAARPVVDHLCAQLSDQRTRHLWARRIAFFTPSALLRLQLQRVSAARTGVAVFADRQSASDWLLEGR